MNRVFIASSLDGFIARADGSLDWLDLVQPLDENESGYRAFFDSVDTLVIGRGTYDVAIGFPQWPYAGKRVIVLTHRPVSALHGEEFWSGDIRDLSLSGSVYVDGGNVIRQFLAANLIDELTLSIVPILLGNGIRLFGGSEHRLTLESHKPFASGMIQLRYRLR